MLEPLSKRRVLMALAAGLALASAWFVSQDEKSQIKLVGASDERNHLATTQTDKAFNQHTMSQTAPRPGRSDATIDRAEAFKVVSFAPLPPPTVQADYVAPPAPRSPPFPFRFFGRVHGNDSDTIYLSQDERLIAVAPAQIIDNLYRVDLVNATEVRITYLPLSEQTILTMPSTM